MNIEPDLAGLERATPGAGGACFWLPEGPAVACPGLCERVGPGAPPVPVNAVAVGAAWPIAHVVDRIELTFSGPPPSGLMLVPEVFDGSRWVRHADGLSATPHGSALTISFEPVATTMLRVPLVAGSRIAGLAVHRYLAEAPAPTWPGRVTTDELARQLLAREEEPSFEALALHGLSMPAWAMIGLKDTGCEQAVWWDGQIHAHGRRIALSLGDPGVRLADVRDTIRRSLMDGWLPGVVLDARIGPVAVRQTAFVAFADGARAEQPATFVRVELTNVGGEPFSGPLRVVASDAPKDPFAGSLGVDVFNPPVDSAPSVWASRGGMLLRGGQPFLVAGPGGRPGGAAGEVAFDVRLAPGATAAFDFAMPCPPWAPTDAGAAELAQVPFARACDGFRAYWERVMAPAMKLDLPEPRLSNLCRAVLAQLFINAWGDLMPYGAAPSNYDGSVYGVEEGYAMLALAMCGFGADAQRYMDRTYLQPHLLAKAEQFTRVEQRNQQNHNGLKPFYAAELFRLTRDRAWIGRHLDVLRECAEWTIASRRKTMQFEDGQKPLHDGLLPKWAYGGDIHEPSHPLYPNFTCWRGLKDTAWVLDELGDVARAEVYRREADDYRRTILSVVDQIYRKDAPRPFLPLRIDATEPDSGDYYQLFAGLLMDLLPFEFDDPRADYLGDFLERDNRTLCLLPRFRRGGVDGGIDALYGLGHLLSRLHQGRIREFLLGFYAYQAFNMEHTCFTSREQNRVYSSDAHLRSSVPIQDWSDPLPCSSAVCLLLLRHLLVTEETSGGGDYTGRLLILPGAPRAWFKPGQRIAVEGAVTHMGPVSFSVVVSGDASRIRAEIALPAGCGCPGLSVRLRHPDGRTMRAAAVDGRSTAAFDAHDECVGVSAFDGTVCVEVEYDSASCGNPR